VIVGAWALGAPRAFYDTFPGAGRAGVGVDGPVKGHRLGDGGAQYLAVATVLLAAAWWGGRTLVRVAAVAGLVWGLPHFLYHLGHLDPLPTTADRIGNVVTLGLSVVAPALVLWLTRRWAAEGASTAAA
jgi:hypothetical protein